MTSAVRITYDPEGDILFITFGAPTPSTGYQVADQVLLRVHPDSRQATGLTILNYSAHARSRSPIPLTGLEPGPNALDILGILTSAPVNRFLRITEEVTGPHAILLQPALDEAVAA
jgi:uncharacterized protein YuzE